MPKNRKLQNIIGTEHITDAAEAAIAAQASGGATVAFKNVAVSGQDNVVADAATDTLTLVGGSNVTITTDASADSVTIAAAAGGDTLPLFQAFNIAALNTSSTPNPSNRFNLTSSPGFFNRGRDSSIGSVSNDIILVPFVLDRDLALTKLGFRANSSDDNQCQIGIYNSDSNGRPTTLISGSTVTAGVTSGGSTGLQFGTLSSALNLSKHTLYYGAIVNMTDGNSVSILCVADSAPSVFHFSGTSDTHAQCIFLSNIGAGPLPSTINLTGTVLDSQTCVMLFAEH
tara:strand:- start:422 stop:1276 length:855 start_codon:yes stop_codon:yes gene_type:complete